jgi:cyclase
MQPDPLDDPGSTTDASRGMIMSRATLAGLALMAIWATGWTAGAATAQQAAPPPPIDFAKVEIKTTDLGHRTYMLEGAGGNITVAVGDDGVILVDGQYAPLHDKIKAAVASLTSQPIRYLIDTHFHGDHTGGNEGFAQDGAVIVAHHAVRERLAAGTTNGLTGVKTPPAPPGALPSKTYTTALTVKIKGRTAELKHPVAAHTDGDTYVYFADANVLSTGDTVAIGRYPNIDFANGGNIRGMITAADIYLKLVNDQTKIVPGHGPLAAKPDLVVYRAMLVAARDRMAKLIAAGTSEDGAIEARPFADFDTKLGATELQSRNFIRVVYRSLKPA